MYEKLQYFMEVPREVCVYSLYQRGVTSIQMYGPHAYTSEYHRFVCGKQPVCMVLSCILFCNSKTCKIPRIGCINQIENGKIAEIVS